MSDFDLNIDGRSLGPGKPTFVIAEIGVNHDGSVRKAQELVTVAAHAGADAVKLQLFKATVLMHPSAGFAEYQKDRVKAGNPIDMLRQYELPTEDVRRVVQAIREKGMVPLATPFSPADVETIAALGLPALKIASPDLVNRPLLARAAALGRPLLVSTGAATVEEVERTVGWLRKWGAPFALLHCVSGYPTPAAQANLCWIQELSHLFGAPVGYSDHTTDVFTGALAAAAGALVIEKHLTYDRAARGPDHSASADPDQFTRYVKQIREADAMRGSPGKRVLPIEEDVRTLSRQSLVVRRELKAGEVLRQQDLTVQRPGTGLSPALIEETVGRKASRALPAGSILQPDMLNDAA
jgi:sialic acid synthase SpsE